MEVSAASMPPRAVAAAVPRNRRRSNDDCEFMRMTEVSEPWRLSFGLAHLCVAVKILLALVRAIRGQQQFDQHIMAAWPRRGYDVASPIARFRIGGESTSTLP